MNKEPATAVCLLAISICFGAETVFAQTNVFPVSGNVGIGTASPAYLLDVTGTTRVGGGTGQILLRINGGNTGTAAGAAVYFGYAGSYLSGVGGYSSIMGGPFNSDLTLFGGPTTNAKVHIMDNSGEVVTIGGGMVGIRTTSPAFRLDVVNDGHNAIRATGNSSNSVGIFIQNTVASGRQWALVSSGGGPSPVGTFVLWDDSAGAARFTVDATGNVGIGTTTPTEKLAVNGRIRAKEVIVETNWSDFVFDPSYRLTPLPELERQVRTDRHLPGIPSAQEVAEGGISIGQMQARLLQKVEELTLYTIQLQKENESLRARVTALEAK